MFATTIQVLALSWAAAGQGAYYEPFPAHQVIGNVYHVGSKDIAVFLIVTDEGHILINSGFEQTVPLIRGGVESLGFKMKDVKIILASHARADHVAGHALLKELHFRGSRGEGNQVLEEHRQFAVFGAVRQSGQELFSHHFSGSRTPPVRMRGAKLRVVPRTITAVSQFRLVHVPTT